MKKHRTFALLLTSILSPWVFLVATQKSAGVDTCTAETETLAFDNDQSRIHAVGTLTYKFESKDHALLRYVGELHVREGDRLSRYFLHRTAEVQYEYVKDYIKMTTLSASRSFSDEAPDALTYRHIHPALQVGNHYNIRIYRISESSIASGTENSPRNICTVK